MRVIGEKWALLVIREIGLGARRFDDIRFNTGAPRDILTARLRSLEDAGVLARIQYQDKPLRFEYALTQAGEHLTGVIQAVRQWGDDNVRPDRNNLVTFHHSCGAELHPKVVCAACGEELTTASVEIDGDIRQSDLTPRV
jgi:DNA-binding HxlR family transcriptional regulator